jgi:hypothetical protein
LGPVLGISILEISADKEVCVGTIDPTLLTVLVSSGILTGLAQLFVAIAGYIRGANERAVIAAKVDANTAITASTHEATDGKMAELLALTKSAAFKDGQKDQVDKQNDINTAVDAANHKPEIPK